MPRSIYIPGFAHSNPVPAAAVVRGLVMTGGIHGSDPETGKVAETMEAQCDNVFFHFKAIMDEAGGTLDDILKVTVWLADPDDRRALNKAWLTTFPDPAARPTRHVRRGEMAEGTYILCDFTAYLGDGGS